jgi:hypothetical protein
MGCGGGLPLLHGAQTLDPGKVTAGAGLSGTFANGGAAAAVREARGATASSTDGQIAAARGDAVIAAFAPSVAPWVAARVGIPSNNEAGLTYAGRAVRLDLRHAFEDGALALSIGAGASVILSGRDEEGLAPGSRFRLALGSMGADVPVLFGWRSDAGIVTLWAGPRGGFQRISGDAAVGPGDPAQAGPLTLQHWYAGGVVGFALGFRHLHGALELDTYYQSVDGSMAGVDVHVSGLTLSPAAALIATF